MADTIYVDGVTLLTADSMNDLNRLNYTILGDPANLAAVKFTVGGVTVKRKTADESVTSSTTLQDDDHLTFAIAANEEWVADFCLNAGAAMSSTGMSLAVTTPSGATLDVMASFIFSSAASTNSNAYAQKTTTSGSAIGPSAGIATGSLEACVYVNVWVLNGANAGSVTLQWAQGSSSGSALTLRKGSHMIAQRVA